VRVPNPHYTFYYTVGFSPCNPLMLLMKIGAIFIIIRRSGVRISESPPLTSRLKSHHLQSYVLGKATKALPTVNFIHNDRILPHSHHILHLSVSDGDACACSHGKQGHCC